MGVIKNKELPTKCPECGHEEKGVETYEWKNTDPESNTRDAKCNMCETIFFEIYECVGWEKL